MKLTKKKPRARIAARPGRDELWLARHSLEIHRKYRGKAIAIWRNQVIAAGRDAVEVAAKADRIAARGQWSLLFVEDMAARV